MTFSSSPPSQATESNSIFFEYCPDKINKHQQHIETTCLTKMCTVLNCLIQQRSATTKAAAAANQTIDENQTNENKIVLLFKDLYNDFITAANCEPYFAHVEREKLSLVIVDGPIGAGKSYFLNNLSTPSLTNTNANSSESLLAVVNEPVDLWRNNLFVCENKKRTNLLQYFYDYNSSSEITNFCLLFQLNVLFTRQFSILKTIAAFADSSKNGGQYYVPQMLFLERAPLSDRRTFVKINIKLGTINDTDLVLYDRCIEHVTNQINRFQFRSPLWMFLISADRETCLQVLNQRIISRARPEECKDGKCQISAEYMNLLYDAYISAAEELQKQNQQVVFLDSGFTRVRSTQQPLIEPPTIADHTDPIH